MFKSINRIILGSALALLGACGSGSNSSTQQFPLNDTVSAYMQMAHNYTLQWTSNGDSYTAQVQMQPGAQHSFQGTVAYTTTVTTAVQKDGNPDYTDSVTDYFLLGPYKNLGSIDNSGDNLTLATNQTPFPDMAKTGQFGPVDDEVTYTGSTSTGAGFLVGYTNTWVLQEGQDALHAKLCEYIAYQGEAAMPGTTYNCVTIDSSGNVLGADVNLLSFVMSGGFN